MQVIVYLVVCCSGCFGGVQVEVGVLFEIVIVVVGCFVIVWVGIWYYQCDVQFGGNVLGICFGGKVFIVIGQF